MSDAGVAATEGTRRRLARTKLALIAALVVFLPFFGGSSSYVGLAVSESLLLALASVALLGHALAGRRQLVLSPFEIVGLVVLAAAAASALAAPYGVGAWHAVGGLLLLGVGYRVARSAAEGPAYAKTVATALLASGALQALLALHQFLFTSWYERALPGYFGEFLASNVRGGALRAVGGFINPNYLAAMCNICLAVVLALLLFGALRWAARTALAALGLVFIGTIVLTGSKAGLAIAAAVVIFLLALKNRLLALVAVVVLLIVVAVPSPLSAPFAHALTADPYFGTRVLIWGASLQMAVDHPIFGVGPTNYQYVSHLYAPPTDQFLVRYAHVPQQAHSSYIQALNEFGLLGFVPLLLLLAAVVAAIAVLVRRNRRAETQTPLLIGFGVGIGGLLLHALVDNAAHNRCLLALGLVMFAAIAVRLAGTGRLPLNPFTRRFRCPVEVPLRAATLLAAAVLLAGFAVAQIWMPLAYETRLREATSRFNAAVAELRGIALPQTATGTGSESVLEQLADLREVARDLERMTPYYPANLGLRMLLGSTHLEIFRHTGDMESFTRALANYEAAADAVPGSRTGAYYQLTAYIELVNRGYPQTEEILDILERLSEDAIRQWPSGASYRQLAARVAGIKGDFRRANELLELAISLEPNYLQAIYDLRNVALELGDDALVQRADGLMQAAVSRIQAAPATEPDISYSRQILALPAPASR